MQFTSLFGTWHVDRAWKEELQKKIGDTLLEADIYTKLRIIFERLDANTFQNYLSDLKSRLIVSSEVKRFGDYFENYWVPKKEMWAHCYRIGQGINTNMYVEAFHRVLKHKYLGAKYNRRVDTA